MKVMTPSPTPPRNTNRARTIATPPVTTIASALTMTVPENRWSKEARDTMANSRAGEPTEKASMDIRRRPGVLTMPRWAMSQPTPITIQIVEMPPSAPATSRA